jgi:hypothetical protein
MTGRDKALTDDMVGLLQAAVSELQWLKTAVDLFVRPRLPR